VKLDLSDLERLADLYDDRAAAIQREPFGGNRSVIREALREALKIALQAGTNPQSELTRYYEDTGHGKYGSQSNEDTSIVNPQEWLDPAGVASIKARNLQTGPHTSLYGSSYVNTGISGLGMQMYLNTRATMTPYAYDPTKDKRADADDLARGMIVNQPTRPIMYYLDHGWTDPKNPAHRMKKREGFRQHVIDAFVPFIRNLPRMLMLGAGFRERA